MGEIMRIKATANHILHVEDNEREADYINLEDVYEVTLIGNQYARIKGALNIEKSAIDVMMIYIGGIDYHVIFDQLHMKPITYRNAKKG